MDKQQNWANQLRQAGWTGMADRVERGQSPSSALFSEVSSSYLSWRKTHTLQGWDISHHNIYKS